MNVLQKCCFRSMKENRKRTLVTIVGIIMASALITGAACLAVSFRASIIAYEIQQNGRYNYKFTDVKSEDINIFENNQYIEDYAVVEGIGYAMLSGSQNPDKPFMYISALDKEGMSALALKLLNGHMPENESELVISRHIYANGGVEINIGDVLTLDVGERIADGYALNQNNPYTYEKEDFEVEETRKYTVVGIIERPNYIVEERMAPGYSVFTYLGETEPDSLMNVYAVYSDWGLRHVSKVNSGILGVSEDLYNRYYIDNSNYTAEEEQQIKTIAESVWSNVRLNRWQTFTFTDNTMMQTLYTMAAIAIVITMITSIFCIRNSFNISLTEKMKLYGRLASVGATPKQQRRIVYYEAERLGLVGIPIGILGGIAASFILIRIVMVLIEQAMGLSIIFAISVPTIAVAVVLSAVTIFLSAFQSAWKAARVSPISAIRSNDMVKIRRKELKTPRIIDRLFGVGGRIAYKNLKRARVKYRTTVISIVVSVSVFIGMSTFVQLGFKSSGYYYKKHNCNFKMTIYDEDGYDKAKQIAALEGVERAEIVRNGFFFVPADSIELTEEYCDMYNVSDELPIYIISLGEDAYERYCREAGVTAEQAEGGAIVVAEYENVFIDDRNRMHTEEGKIAYFHKGDFIEGSGAGDVSIEVITQTQKRPLAIMDVTLNSPVFIVSDKWMDNHRDALTKPYEAACEIYLKCKDATAIEELVLRDMELVKKYNYANFEEQYKSERSMYLVIAIFLYGFIAVVALIGVTNIFNTVTTNMELRAPEFAMLKAIGMTNREFKRMIWIEGLFYGGKALIIGLSVGIVISYAFYKALGVGIVMSYSLPIEAIAVSIAAVFVLLFGIMRYYMGKLRGKNLIEIINNENI